MNQHMMVEFLSHRKVTSSVVLRFYQILVSIHVLFKRIDSIAITMFIPMIFLPESYNAHQQIYTWVQKYKKNGEDALKDRRGRHKKKHKPQTEEERLKLEVVTLKRQLYLAQVENDVLKNYRIWRGGITEPDPTAASLPDSKGTARGKRLCRPGPLSTGTYCSFVLLQVVEPSEKQP